MCQRIVAPTNPKIVCTHHSTHQDVQQIATHLPTCAKECLSLPHHNYNQHTSKSGMFLSLPAASDPQSISQPCRCNTLITAAVAEPKLRHPAFEYSAPRYHGRTNVRFSTKCPIITSCMAHRALPSAPVLSLALTTVPATLLLRRMLRW